MSMLKSRLYEIEIQKREDAKSDAHGEKTDIGWGHQIRSYVLHPYQMIKDLRTNAETNQSDKVLNGDLDMFLESALSYKVGGEDKE
jgi:peptide chain release factor 2